MDLKTWCDKERGRAAALASTLGVPPAFISQMSTDDRPVPPIHGAAIEAATLGEVRRWDLRPRDWHRIWPELVGTEGAPEPESYTGPDRRKPDNAAKVIPPRRRRSDRAEAAGKS